MLVFSAPTTRTCGDSLPIRLGGLAANLARVQSFCDNPAHMDVVARLLDKSAWFIEWAAPDAPVETHSIAWVEIWADPVRRAEVAGLAGDWSQRFLDLSGLVQAASQGSIGHRA